VPAATDPAQPYGAAIPWPSSNGRPSRSTGAFVVIVDGEACAFVERGGRRLITFPAATGHPEWVEALASLVHQGRSGRLRLERIDDAPAAASEHAAALRSVGFVEGYKGLTLRA
jgi:ATP-dependent Lhr-like helicase